MAVLYADTFSSRTGNPFWNDNSGVTFTGTAASIAANGNWLGASGLAASARSQREIIWQQVSGDRPGAKVYNSGADEIASLTFVSTGTLRWSVNGGAYSSVAFDGAHGWRRIRLRVGSVLVSTSPDGSAWADVVNITTAPDPDLLTGLYLNNAGSGIGDGRSTVAATVDNFTWQDFRDPIALGTATSSDLALALTIRKRLTVGTAFETTAALPLTVRRSRAIAAAVEISTAGRIIIVTDQTLPSTSAPTLLTIADTDTTTVLDDEPVALAVAEALTELTVPDTTTELVLHA